MAYNKAASDKYRATHKEMLSARFKAWYATHAEQQRAKALKWRVDNLEQSRRYHVTHMKSIRDRLAAIKIARGCMDCGYNEHPAALDFDHVIGKKAFTLQRSTSLRKALSEIEKCEVRCANCHRVATAKRRSQPLSDSRLQTQANNKTCVSRHISPKYIEQEPEIDMVLR